MMQAITRYAPSADLEVIQRAYEYADEKHKNQLRKSGEPYIIHPLAVAEIVAEIGLDTDAITAALLHDCLEDTDASFEEISRMFGETVANLVEGVTKLTRVQYSTMEEQQMENLRKMFMAMSKDIRVILIKIADRLHNTRTLQYQTPAKQISKSMETMEVYAPLAHRLGMQKIKWELEDTSLQYLDPEGYQEIIDYLKKNEDSANSFMNAIQSKITNRLASVGIHGSIYGRIKHTYSIYRKMRAQNKTIDELYDLYAFRVIVDNIADCYNVLGHIHDLFNPIPGRFKDYISTPKPNMYQSLHTTVIGHEGIPFEVQIRTWEMDQTAEYGVAAHWKYKAGVSTKDKLDDRIAWVRQLLESQRESEDAGDLLRDIKSELLPEEVFAFTPKGDVINLPAGATVIDFAYAIHSAVGNRMVGAKVNSRIVPIDHKVVTGEIIEIITGPKDKGPSRDWLNLVATSEAKNKIRNWFKKERKEENITEGKAALDKEMRRNLITIPEEKYDEFMADLARRQRLNTPEELYAAIGYGGIQLSRLMIKIKDEYTKLLKEQSPAEVLQVPIKKQKSSEGVIVEGLDNCLVKFAKCCNPLPGDDIIGFLTRGFGVSIHKRSCSNARAGLLGDDAPRWVNAHWAESVKESFKSSLEISAMDRDGLMADVAGLIAEMHLPCYAISARQLADGRATMALTIGVNNTEHLNTVIARLRKIKSITTITRV